MDYRKKDYYFGAALVAFLKKNKGSKPSLLEDWEDENTSCYQMTTDSLNEFRILMKYSVSNNSNWQFKLTDKERTLIEESIASGKKMFFFFICSKGEFDIASIAVLTLSQMQTILHKTNFTIKPNSPGRLRTFCIPTCGAEPLLIPSNRIEDDLANIKD